MNYYELHSKVEQKEIVSAKNKEGRIYRLFHATNGRLCYFPKGKSRVGYAVDETLFETFVSFQGKPEPLSADDKLKKRYNEIAKYKKLAQAATFENSWVKDCKNLPNFETWKKDVVTEKYGTPCEPTQKCLYDFHVTTGNKIDGKVISLSRIAKQYPYYVERLREAIKNKTAMQICSSTPFAGYDMSLSTANREVGEFIGYLSLEFKGCGNGYYYLLINDENFIGYDVD